MEDNVFWFRIWRMLGFGVLLVLAMVGGCTCYQSKLTADLIKTGVAPGMAKCAVEGDDYGRCYMLFTQATTQTGRTN